MKVYEAVAARIQELFEKRKMTVNGLATLSGLSPSTVKSIIYGASRNPGVATVKILCDGLGISLVGFSTRKCSGNWSRRSSERVL